MIPTIGELIVEDIQRRGGGFDAAAGFLRKCRPAKMKKRESEDAIRVWLNRLSRGTQTAPPNAAERSWLASLAESEDRKSQYLNAPFAVSNVGDEDQEHFHNLVANMPDGAILKILHLGVPFASNDASALSILHVLLMAKRSRVQYFVPRNLNADRRSINAKKFAVDLATKLILLSCIHYRLTMSSEPRDAMKMYRAKYEEQIDDDFETGNKANRVGKPINQVEQLAETVISLSLRTDIDAKLFRTFHSVLCQELSVFSFQVADESTFNPFAYCLIEYQSNDTPRSFVISGANRGREYSEFAPNLKSYFYAVTSSGLTTPEVFPSESCESLASSWGIAIK